MDQRKKTSLIENQNDSQIMSLVANNKQFDSNKETKNIFGHFNVSNCLEDSINTHNTGDEFKWESDFFSRILVMMILVQCFPLEVFWQYCRT